MTRTNIDYLFQVTSADRAFTLPRVDEASPPFGNHLSLAAGSTFAEPGQTARREDDRYASSANRSSDSTSNDADDRAADSTTRETSEATSPSDEPQSSSDPSAENGSPADADGDSHDIEAEASNSSETSAEAEETDADEPSDPLAEAAAAQANAVNPAKAETSAKAVEDVAEGSDAVAALEKQGGGEPKAHDGKQTVHEKGDRGAAAVAAVAGTSDAGAELQADGASLPPSATTEAKKARSAGASKNSADEQGAEHHKLGTAAHDESQANNGAAATVAALHGDAQAEQTSIEQPASGEEQSASDELNGTQNDRANSRQRADVIAIANRIMAAAVSGAAPANNGAAAGDASDDRNMVAKPQAAKSDSLAAAAERLQSQNATGKRGARTDGADDMPHVDPARFVGRVAKAFQTAHERGGTLQLRLAPPELGALRLELTVKDGVMSASLEAESQTARRVLLDHLPALRERLAEQNIRVERFDVDVRREGSGQEPAPQNQERQRQNQSDSRRQQASQSRTDDAARHERPIIAPLSNNTGINLVA